MIDLAALVSFDQAYFVWQPKLDRSLRLCLMKNAKHGENTGLYMSEPYYFEIPVYRCSIKTHTAEMKSKEREFTHDEWKEVAPESYQNSINYFDRTIWYPWRYNEIIGWIRLYVMGNQIRGEYYFDASGRIRKGIRKKKYVYCGKAFEHHLFGDMTSQEIFNEIISVLEKINKNEKPFKKRYIDLTTFKTIGEFVDWKMLIDNLGAFK